MMGGRGAKRIDFTDSTHHRYRKSKFSFLVGPSFVFVFYEEICQKWSFFSLREHFSGAKRWF
jgi:hypothetical protein